MLPEGSPPLPLGQFDLTLADFPLAFAPWGKDGDRKSPQQKYRCLSLGEAMAMAPDITAIAAKNSVLAMWSYDPLLPFSIELMEAAGFRFVTRLFTWIKGSSAGHLQIGTGYYTRKSSEIVILGKRGRGLPVRDHSVPDVIFAPRQEHSRKPHEARVRLERLFGDVRRLELFARGPCVPGWVPWGDQAEPSDSVSLPGFSAPIELVEVVK